MRGVLKLTWFESPGPFTVFRAFFFLVKLVEICAGREWEFMQKAILKLLGSFQGSELGATRRCRIKTKEVKGHAEKPSRNCLLLGILNA